MYNIRTNNKLIAIYSSGEIKYSLDGKCLQTLQQQRRRACIHVPHHEVETSLVLCCKCTCTTNIIMRHIIC